MPFGILHTRGYRLSHLQDQYYFHAETRQAEDNAEASISQLLAECLRSEPGVDLEESEDQGPHNFDRLIGEVLSMRERLQNMPDDQRRRAAGDLMLHIHEQLGLSDEDSDPDSES